MMADMTPPTMYHCVNGSKPRRTRDAQTLALTTHFVSLLMWYCKRAGREDASSLGDGGGRVGGKAHRYGGFTSCCCPTGPIFRARSFGGHTNG